MAKQEADIRFRLPGTASMDSSLDIPDEQVIELFSDGRIVVNESGYDLYGLRAVLSRFQESCAVNKVDSRIIIAPEDNVTHERIVQVMDMCALAGIRHMHFALGDES